MEEAINPTVAPTKCWVTLKHINTTKGLKRVSTKGKLVNEVQGLECLGTGEEWNTLDLWSRVFCSYHEKMGYCDGWLY